MSNQFLIHSTRLVLGTVSDDDSVADAEDEDSIDGDDDQENILRVFAMIHSNNEDENRFDPEAEEERQYADYQDALNDTEIVGCVTAVVTYEDDDYNHVPHTDSRFDACAAGWPGPITPMPNEKAEVEHVYFCGSDYNNNIQGFDMNPGRVHPEVAREMARRPTSNAPSNNTDVSLEVIVRRVALLLNKPEGYVQPVLDAFHKIGIRNCHTLDSTLSETLNDRQQAERFTILFEGSSDGIRLCVLSTIALLSVLLDVHEHEMES